jgi:predicted lysophospholipase L1 biosynthesis ABC-type transport system permease subunit
VAAITHDHDLPSVTIGTRGSVAVHGTAISAFGFRRVRGDALPQATEGHVPSANDEIALGAQTLRDVGRSVGDTVAVTGSDGAAVRMRIVGRTLLPSLSLNGTLGLGEGAALTAAALAKLDPEAQPSFFLVNKRPGVRMATLARRYDAISSVLGPQRPGDVTSYARVRATPLVLAALLGLLGLGVLSHLLVTSIRSRRRDLAVLKTLGFGRGQVRATIAWQATTLVAIALAVGVPIGLIAGRWVWRNFADGLGVDAGVIVPALAFGLVAAGALFLANLIAAVPARRAARTRPAIVLRSE